MLEAHRPTFLGLVYSALEAPPLLCFRAARLTDATACPNDSRAHSLPSSPTMHAYRFTSLSEIVQGSCDGGSSKINLPSPHLCAQR